MGRLSRGTNVNFPDKLIVSPLKTEWEIQRDFRYVDRDIDTEILVPAGFKTDFASIPRIFWAILPPWDVEYGKPAVIHDYLYRRHEYAKRAEFKRGNIRYQNRKWADKIFLRGMKQNGENIITRQIIYWAVRIFGSGCFRAGSGCFRAGKGAFYVG
jgi:hypothetical protein